MRPIFYMCLCVLKNKIALMVSGSKKSRGKIFFFGRLKKAEKLAALPKKRTLTREPPPPHPSKCEWMEETFFIVVVFTYMKHTLLPTPIEFRNSSRCYRHVILFPPLFMRYATRAY